MPTVKVSDLFKLSPLWHDLYIDFYNYKLCGDQPPRFGRDAPLDLDDVHHIHLAQGDSTVLRWRKLERFHRTHLSCDPGSDYWLIYAYDACKGVEGEYLLLTVLGPDAHNRKRWGSFLRNVAQSIVVPWIHGRTDYSEPDN